MTIFTYMIHFILAFLSSIAFSIIFNVPKRELLYCGITGGAGWIVLKLLQVQFGLASTISMFFATLMIAVLSRLFAIRRKVPMTVYLIAGFIPLVPGYGVFYTMQHIVNNEYALALTEGIDTLKIGGIMVVGMMIIFSLPRQLFAPSQSRKSDTK